MYSAVRKTSSVSSRARRGIVQSIRVGGVLATAASVFALFGCGNAYRPVVSAINPVGPSAQPQKYAVAISSTGVLSVIDVSGDTLVSTAQLSPNPIYLNVGISADAYVLHCATAYNPADFNLTTGNPNYCGGNTGTFSTNAVIDAASISSKLMTKDVYQTSLPSAALPQVVVPFTNNIYTAQVGSSSIGVLSTGQPPTAQTEVPVVANPSYIVTRSGTIWHYALSQGAVPGTSNGVVTPILASNNTPASGTSDITVGKSPVYGVMSADTRRAFVLNQGSGTVSVINTQTNTLDVNSSFNGTVSVGSNPLWADIADSINELAVLNKGATGSNGSLSIINIPLCTATTVPGNGACDSNNPVDANGFGQVLATVSVGKGARMVSVLQDQSKAYVANYLDKTISVIDLKTFTKIKDITVDGHPTWVVATSGNPRGKVYVVSPDVNYLQIIYTDDDTLQATKIDLQGPGVGLRVTAQ